MSVTAAQQTAPASSAALTDSELRALYEGLVDVRRPLQSVDDVATWLEMEHDVDRVRPYVMDVESQGELRLQLTDEGKSVLMREKGFSLDFDEPAKRTRRALIKHPTPAQVGLMEMKLEKLRIDEG
jgi:hypothetical protein